MALDLIKQYLIGIGFNVDSNSLVSAEDNLKQVEGKIDNFNKKGKKGFSETSDSMKDLFKLFQSTTLGAFPELQKPLNNLAKDIKLAERVYKNLVKVTNSKDTKSQEETKKTPEKATTNIKKIISNAKLKESKQIEDIPIRKIKSNIDFKEADKKESYFNYLTKDILKVKKHFGELKESSKSDLKGIGNVAKELSEKGGKSILGFSLKSVARFAVIGIAVIALVGAFKKLIGSLNNLASEDIEIEKLSRQLWTTKQNARDIDGALKTLGVTMQDLWLSPTLLKQFNQLRNDSAQLRLPPEFEDNIKVVQGLGLEFKRLKQFISLALKWIGNYILKYLAGPLNDIKRGLSKFNNGLLKAIPVMGKVIGSTIGIILRLILTVGKVLSPIFSIISHFIKFIINLIDKIPGPIKNIIKIIGLIAGLIVAGPIGAIMLVIAAIDDLFTFLSGGKSVIGNVFDFLKEKGTKAIDKVKDKFKEVKENFKSNMSSIKDDWDNYWDKASKTLDKLKDKAKKVWADIKEWSKGLWEKTKDFAANVSSKIEGYDNSAANTSTPQSYLTNNTANNTSMANSNNKVNNENVFNIYGTDAKSTANEVKSKVSGVTTRNLQGVF